MTEYMPFAIGTVHHLSRFSGSFFSVCRDTNQGFYQKASVFFAVKAESFGVVGIKKLLYFPPTGNEAFPRLL